MNGAFTGALEATGLRAGRAAPGLRAGVPGRGFGFLEALVHSATRDPRALVHDACRRPSPERRNGTGEQGLEPQGLEAPLAREIAEHEKTREALLKAQADLTAFSYAVVHDMRAPLRAITSFGQLLLDEEQKLSATGKEHLARMMSTAQRMDALIRDVLSCCKIASEPVQLSRINVEGLVVELLQENPSLQSPGVAVKVERPMGEVLAHPALLAQCLSHLLENATKFVRARRKARVRVWTERIGKQVRVWVGDNGIGIPKERQEVIFDMFRRLHALGEYGGTGIGLTIVRAAVQRMSGRCGVESRPGKGSRFWLELPAG